TRQASLLTAVSAPKTGRGSPRRKLRKSRLCSCASWAKYICRRESLNPGVGGGTVLCWTHDRERSARHVTCTSRRGGPGGRTDGRLRRRIVGAREEADRPRQDRPADGAAPRGALAARSRSFRHACRRAAC